MTDPRGTSTCAPLHAADWRFLLPHPVDGYFRHLVLLGGPSGLAARVGEIGLAQVVSREIPPQRLADAMAVFRDARATYSEIARALVPGGALYLEIDRRSPWRVLSGPGRVRRALRQVGLNVTAIYAVGPNLSAARIYLPLDVPAALRWYVDTRYIAATPWLALIEAAVRAATGLDPRRFARVAPDLAITAVAGGGRPRHPSVLGLPVFRPDFGAKGVLPVLLTRTSHGTVSRRVVMLPFAPDGLRPLAVLKVSKLPSLNVAVEDEQKMLGEIRSLLDPAMRRTIPEPLGVQRYGGLSVAVESYSPGESLQRSSGRWGRPPHAMLDDLRLAAAWLGEFHRQTQIRRPPWGAPEVAQWVDQPFEAYRQTFGITDREALLFADARRYAQSLTGAQLPIVWRQPDVNMSNILRARHELSVIDWETARVGPALCDLLRFITHWYDAVRRIRGDGEFGNFRTLFFKRDADDATARGVDQVVARYLSQLSIDPRLIPMLLVYSWVDAALHRSDRQLFQGEDYRDARANNRHIGRVAVLAEHRVQLFASQTLRLNLRTTA